MLSSSELGHALQIGLARASHICTYAGRLQESRSLSGHSCSRLRQGRGRQAASRIALFHGICPICAWLRCSLCSGLSRLPVNAAAILALCSGDSFRPRRAAEIFCFCSSRILVPFGIVGFKPVNPLFHDRPVGIPRCASLMRCRCSGVARLPRWAAAILALCSSLIF
jgi:hypothetical protein